VFGNLFHHGFEMILKSALSRGKTLKEVAAYRHDLPKLWTAFEALYGVPEAMHTKSAQVIHMFEEFRYPESTLDHAMDVSIVGMGISAVQFSFGSKRGYGLLVNVDQLEDWWLYIHKVAGYNVLFHESAWPAELKAVYLSERARSQTAGP